MENDKYKRKAWFVSITSVWPTFCILVGAQVEWTGKAQSTISNIAEARWYEWACQLSSLPTNDCMASNSQRSEWSTLESKLWLLQDSNGRTSWSYEYRAWTVIASTDFQAIDKYTIRRLTEWIRQIQRQAGIRRWLGSYRSKDDDAQEESYVPNHTWRD